MRVLLVDDHRLLVEGLISLLEAHGIEVAGTARDGRQAIAAARTLRPDVILMDLTMPNLDGLAATRLIRAEWPEARIVILTTSTADRDLFEAVKSGACGYLLKSMDADELVEALGQAQDGIPPFAPGLAARLLAEFARLAASGEGKAQGGGEPGRESGGSEEAEVRLTGREREVLALVARGLSYKEVGAQLHLSPRTVKYHMAEIMARLHLEHRAQVLAYAGRMGIEPGQ
ncbi:MAG TPA: response regulator transcription factor [Anaerolineae bacterium]|nr:response regulator transcription factor [Anaerolineae bacterium]